MKVVRIYHAGRDASHRERDRALARAGIELTLVVPRTWPGPNQLGGERFEVVELPVRRPGNVNRHVYSDASSLTDLITSVRPDVVDLHEEPFSDVTHQVLRGLPWTQAVVGYTAQNLDKRFPPPYSSWERSALARLNGLYPCSRQAASVAVGKGFRGPVRVLPLAPDPVMTAGSQNPPRQRVNLLLVGRLVPEKGVLDAVRTLASLPQAYLRIVGEGPERDAAVALAAQLGVVDRLSIHGWMDAAELAACYQQAHVLLAPSRATSTWVEQFGRMTAEAQACGAVVAGYASGALPEVVGDAGVLVPEGDHGQLADVIRRWTTEPAEWTLLREAGLAAAAGRTWDAVAAGQVDLYRAALKHPASHRVHPDRAIARSRWGAPANEQRVFALPLLRESRFAARVADSMTRRQTARRPGRHLRVVYIDHVARLSGAELSMLQFIRATPGIEAHVILGEDGPLVEPLTEAGATVEVMPFETKARNLHRGQVGPGLSAAAAATTTARYTLRLARRLRELDPDLVHTNSLKASYYGSVAARLAGLPVIVHVRDRIASDYLPEPAVRLTRALLATTPDLVVANSRATLATVGDVRRSCVLDDVVEEAPLRAKEPSGLTIGIVGRLSPWKGHDVFLKAVALLAHHYPSLQGRIVGAALFGEDGLESQLREIAEHLGISERVTFTGHVTDVHAQLAEFSVLVHASTLPEPFGQVVVEGMAAGVPVVATDAGGPAEVVTDGHDGLLVPPGDAERLAAAVQSLLDDPSLRERLVVNGRATAERFRPEAVGPQVRALYESVARLASPS